MNIRKTSLQGLLVVVMLLAIPLSAWGGTGFIEPPDGGDFVGPELWAVVVMKCGGATIPTTMRIKRINDCNVETIAIYSEDTSLFCPTQAQEAENMELDINPWGLRPSGGATVLTKVKNFKTDGAVVSFDAKLNFWKPTP